MSEIKERLEKDIAVITWKDVLPHAKKDLVIVVESGLDLIIVGEAIAKDNSHAVNNWIQQQQVAKPSIEQLNQWNNNPTTTNFNALILQPYVIVQLIQ